MGDGTSCGSSVTALRSRILLPRASYSFGRPFPSQISETRYFKRKLLVPVRSAFGWPLRGNI
jgi:hypothetical protein